MANMLTADEKELIELMFKDKTSICQIAKELERSVSTISTYLKSVGLRDIKSKSTSTEQKICEPTNFDACRTASLTDKKASIQASDRQIMRGDIYYVNFPPYVEVVEYKPARPAIIVSNAKNNMYSNFVEVVFLTTKPKKPLPTHVTVRSFNQFAIAMCEQIHTVSKKQLQTYGHTCSEHEMKLIDNALAVSLELNFDKEPVEVNNEPEPPVMVNEPNAEYLMVLAERNTYKRLYEELLDKLVRR